MQVKAKGLLWAVALSLCCMGCGEQETPAPQPAEEPVSVVVEPSQRDQQDNWTLIDSDVDQLTLRFSDKAGNPVAGLYFEITLVEELEPGEKRADVGPEIITAEGGEAYCVTDENGEYVWKDYSPVHCRLLASTSPRDRRTPEEKVESYSLDLTGISGHYLVEFIWDASQK